MSSPDFFRHVRVSQASIKASSLELQLAEYRAHKRQVEEYKSEMHEHLLDMETKTRPNLHLIQQQPEINLRMRPLLLDFLMDVINKLNLSKSTFPLTVNIIDRYCSIRIVKKQHYQLLGLTALWIACKNLDSKFRIPALSDLCKYCCHCYDKKLFLEMENHVLKSLNWLVDAPTFDAFIDLNTHTLALSPFLAGSKNPHKDCNDVKIVAIYICELIQFYPNIYFNYTPPKVALISVLLACLILDIGSGFTTTAFLKYVSDHTGVATVTDAQYNSAFALLIKVLKCPPPSLKSKYFNEDSRFLHFMKLLVAFAWKHLAPNSVFSHTGAAPTSADCPVFDMEPCFSVSASHTPTSSFGGSTTPKFYPATPLSSTISPKNQDYDHRFEQRPRLTASVSYKHDLQRVSPASQKTLPSPNLSPAEQANASFGKRSYEYEGAPVPVKRSKSVSKMFYIN